MKNFTAFLFLMITSTSFAQNDYIKGIGPFKVGLATTSIINEIAEKSKIKIKESTNLMESYGAEISGKNTKIVLLLKYSEKDRYRYDPQFVNHPDVKTYFIDYYEVAEIPIKRIYLSFYRDTLYDFQCEYSTALKDAISLKYGDAKDSVSVKKIKCNSRLAGDFEQEEKSFYFSWPTGDNITNKACIGHYYDYKCEKSYLSYFLIENTPLRIIINKEAARRDYAEEDRLKAEKKSKLSEF